MAYEYDRFEREDGGGSFLMGLLAGTVLGAGLGMLFAPKAGSDLRGQLSEQAGNIANTASDKYRRATESAAEWADKGREAYDRTRDAVTKGVDEAQRYVRDAATSFGGSQPTQSNPSGPTSSGPTSSGSSYGTSGSSSWIAERNGPHASSNFLTVAACCPAAMPVFL